jgi:pyrroline-5-carboxylate reductase
MQLGFIGTGNITTALVEGLCTADVPGLHILLSPRNAAKASRLAAKFSQVEIAENNQAVIRACNTVVLALRPQAALAILRELQFQSGQKIISLIAVTPLAVVRNITAPARNVCRAVPLPSVARRSGPILIHPDHAYANDILSHVGRIFPVADEKKLELLWTLTALISPYYALLETASNWAAAAGLEQQTAKDYTAAMFFALSQQAMDVSGKDFSAMVKEAATPGGLNEQALQIIRSKGAYNAFRTALDSVAARLGVKASGPLTP